MPQTYDRAAEDLGNSIHLEHVNVCIPDQRLATLFYVAGLGLTRDPYLMVSDNNMWINVGRSQFHLPTADAQVLRGTVGLVIAGREALLARLAAVRPRLKGTRFDFKEHNDHVSATCPWGNSFRIHEPDVERFGRITLGIPYVEFNAPVGSAQGIAKFYRDMLSVPADVVNGQGTSARAKVGKDQYLTYRETERPQPEFDDHHVQIYVADFSGPHKRLNARKLVNKEDNQYQYRFKDIVDLDSGKLLFTIEHEVRSVTHPMFLRPLVNRDPRQTNRNWSAGYDSMPYGLVPEHFDNQPERPPPAM